MMFAFSALALVIGLQLRIVLNGSMCRLPERVTQIRRAPFTHVHTLGLKLAALVNTRIYSSVSYQLFDTAKTLDISDLGQDGRSRWSLPWLIQFQVSS